MRPLFSADGKRLIIVEQAYASRHLGKARILAFPSLETLYEADFSGHRIFTMEGNRLVIGDELGQLAVIDVVSGNTLYYQKHDEIFGLGLTEGNDLVFSDKQGFQKKYHRIDVKSGKTLAENISNADYVFPIAIAKSF